MLKKQQQQQEEQAAGSRVAPGKDLSYFQPPLPMWTDTRSRILVGCIEEVVCVFVCDHVNTVRAKWMNRNKLCIRRLDCGKKRSRFLDTLSVQLHRTQEQYCRFHPYGNRTKRRRKRPREKSAETEVRDRLMHLSQFDDWIGYPESRPQGETAVLVKIVGHATECTAGLPSSRNCSGMCLLPIDSFCDHHAPLVRSWRFYCLVFLA
jgi:hypothetical protein